MSKKNILKLLPDDENYSALFGLSSHENDYRVCWALNACLGLHLTKSNDHSSFHPKLKLHQTFSCYSYIDFYLQEFKLISNRCDNGFLLDEYKNIDFLFAINVKGKALSSIEFIEKIKTISFVSAVFKLDIASIKNKRDLF